MGFGFSFLSFALGSVACASVSDTAPVAAPTTAEAPAAGTARRLPDITVLGLDRQPRKLSELISGRPAVIHLWATWCEACKDELDALSRLQRRLGDQARVIGIAEGESCAKVSSFLEERTLDYAQVVDEPFALADALGSKRVPTTLIVDRDGVVRHSGGELDSAALEALKATLRK